MFIENSIQKKTGEVASQELEGVLNVLKSEDTLQKIGENLENKTPEFLFLMQETMMNNLKERGMLDNEDIADIRENDENEPEEENKGNEEKIRLKGFYKKLTRFGIRNLMGLRRIGNMLFSPDTIQNKIDKGEMGLEEKPILKYILTNETIRTSFTETFKDKKVRKEYREFIKTNKQDIKENIAEGDTIEIQDINGPIAIILKSETMKTGVLELMKNTEEREKFLQDPEIKQHLIENGLKKNISKSLEDSALLREFMGKDDFREQCYTSLTSQDKIWENITTTLDGNYEDFIDICLKIDTNKNFLDVSLPTLQQFIDKIKNIKQQRLNTITGISQEVHQTYEEADPVLESLYENALETSMNKVIEKNPDFLSSVFEKTETQDEVMGRMKPQTPIANFIIKHPNTRKVIFSSEMRGDKGIIGPKDLLYGLDSNKILRRTNKKTSEIFTENNDNTKIIQEMMQDKECQEEVISMIGEEKSLLKIVLKSVFIQGKTDTTKMDENAQADIKNILKIFQDPKMNIFINDLFTAVCSSEKQKELANSTPIDEISGEAKSIFETENIAKVFQENEKLQTGENGIYTIMDDYRQPVAGILKNSTFREQILEYSIVEKKDEGQEEKTIKFEEALLQSLEESVDNPLFSKIIKYDKAQDLCKKIIRDESLRNAIADYIYPENTEQYNKDGDKKKKHIVASLADESGIKDILADERVKKGIAEARRNNAAGFAMLMRDPEIFPEIINDNEIQASIKEGLAGLSDNKLYKTILNNEFNRIIIILQTNNLLGNRLAGVIEGDKNTIASMLQGGILDYFVSGDSTKKDMLYTFIDRSAIKRKIIAGLKNPTNQEQMFNIIAASLEKYKDDIIKNIKLGKGGSEITTEMTKLFQRILANTMTNNSNAKTNEFRGAMKGTFYTALENASYILENFSIKDIIEGDAQTYEYIVFNTINDPVNKREIIESTIGNDNFIGMIGTIMQDETTIKMMQNIIKLYTKHSGKETEAVGNIASDLLGDADYISTLFGKDGLKNDEIQNVLTEFLMNIDISDPNKPAKYIREYETFMRDNKGAICKEMNIDNNIKTIVYREKATLAMEIHHDQNGTFSLFNGGSFLRPTEIKEIIKFQKIEDALFMGDLITRLQEGTSQEPTPIETTRINKLGFDNENFNRLKTTAKIYFNTFSDKLPMRGYFDREKKNNNIKNTSNFTKDIITAIDESTKTTDNTYIGKLRTETMNRIFDKYSNRGQIINNIILPNIADQAPGRAEDFVKGLQTDNIVRSNIKDSLEGYSLNDITKLFESNVQVQDILNIVYILLNIIRDKIKEQAVILGEKIVDYTLDVLNPFD